MKKPIIFKHEKFESTASNSLKTGPLKMKPWNNPSKIATTQQKEIKQEKKLIGLSDKIRRMMRSHQIEAAEWIFTQLEKPLTSIIPKNVSYPTALTKAPWDSDNEEDDTISKLQTIEVEITGVILADEVIYVLFMSYFIQKS